MITTTKSHGRYGKPARQAAISNGSLAIDRELVAVRPEPAQAAPRTATKEVPSFLGPTVGPLQTVLRYGDLVTALVLLFVVSVLTNAASMSLGLDGLLAMRITVKNLILVGAFVYVWQSLFSAFGLHGKRRFERTRDEIMTVLMATTTATLLLSIVPALGISATIQMPAVLLFGVLAAPAVLVVRGLIRRIGLSLMGMVRMRQVIIVGSGPRAQRAYESVVEHPEVGYNVLGFIDTNERIDSPSIRERILGRLDELPSILMHRNVDLVLITLPTKSCYEEIQQVISVCERIGVESRYLADIFQGNLARQQYEPAGAMSAVAMKVVQDDARVVMKRMFDVAAATLGLIALLPVLTLIALVIRVTSPGPIIFAQDRYGKDRRIFKMFKFRTMVSDAEAIQYSLEHLNEITGPTFKIKNDPRVTPFGRILRKTSLDELPQLLNVILGDMSLVGPRPLPLRDVQHFEHPWLMRRFSVLPGLTCLWQISGRSSETDFGNWVNLDLKYIDQWSLGLDLRILAATVPAVLRGTGAC
jgi:exopolysaccharide biosynthesis polyprenyl glycosylphosphotransferase